MAAGRRLKFDRTGSSAIRDMAIWSSTYHGGFIWQPNFEGREPGGRRGSSIVPLGRAMSVSYTLSIVTIALSLIIRPQSATEYLRRSIQQGGGGSICARILGCSLWSTPVRDVWVCGLSNSEIIFEEFQPMWSRYVNDTDRRTDRRTDNLP